MCLCSIFLCPHLCASLKRVPAHLQGEDADEQREKPGWLQEGGDAAQGGAAAAAGAAAPAVKLSALASGAGSGQLAPANGEVDLMDLLGEITAQHG